MLIVIILLILVLGAVGALAAYMFTNMNKPAGLRPSRFMKSRRKTRRAADLRKDGYLRGQPGWQ
ncbi:hypothetical protein [Chromobacterium vaccinii]|uniref:hypothetical protein n=1 Tax=Chromobacterium vaccinii TaxID=1108595 RepID=UPI0021B29A59|nr:hypothetical protein [Chromobacterium vaccinii]